ncbi:hypothetical protein GOP47_0026562 [Adiantum capillus-veneris]|nr:hypothetical protein GOP47_0026562 [Adiantum capillus-veneris]
MVLGTAQTASCRGRQGHCVEWVRRYLKDCICNTRDAISFGVGLASVFCWGVAEVPQIITNFREGSTEGISLIFLMTWVIGDGFNLVGCYLEPSTLPTQFYMALLYTITTLILVGQVVYYQHYLKWRKGQRMVTPTPPMKPEAVDETKAELPKPTQPVPAQQMASQPIAYSPSSAPVRELYYTSARSLASSHTPTAGSYLAAGSRGSGGQGTYHSLLQHKSEPIPISIDTARSAPAPTMVTSGSPHSILRAVVSVGICVGGLNIGRGFMQSRNHNGVLSSGHARVFSERKLLQLVGNTLHQESEMGESVGMWLGWMMAAIYMGGRLPQIYLNIKRGSVEGLNPLMFMFALLGNVTYVGSILIRSTEWQRIKSNMPWLVDAGVCVALDFLILYQFIYYCARRKPPLKDDTGGDYKSLA